MAQIRNSFRGQLSGTELGKRAMGYSESRLAGKGPNRQFVVTSLSMDPESPYGFYTERGGTCDVRTDEIKRA
jgi:hypothetical protein